MRSKRPCLAKLVSMWSRKGTGVFMSPLPPPSRFSSTVMSVSLVFLETLAFLAIVYPFLFLASLAAALKPWASNPSRSENLFMSAPCLCMASFDNPMTLVLFTKS